MSGEMQLVNNTPVIEVAPIKIRIAELKDLEQILKYAIAFHRELVDQSTPIDMKSLAVHVVQTMNRPDSVVYMASSLGEPVGMAAAMFYPLFFDFSHITGQELWWYVDPLHRGGGAGLSLLEGLESEAKERGAKSFSMISLASGGKKVELFYRRCGYKKLQTIYTKKL